MHIIATAGLRGFVGLSLLAARHADTMFIITTCQNSWWSKFHFFSPKNVGFFDSKLGQVTDVNQTIACGLNSSKVKVYIYFNPIPI